MNVWKAFEEKNPKLGKMGERRRPLCDCFQSDNSAEISDAPVFAVSVCGNGESVLWLAGDSGNNIWRNIPVEYLGIRSGTWRTCVFYGIYDGNDYRRMYKFSDPEAFCVPKPWEYRKADCMVYGSILCDYVYRQFNQLRLGSGGRIICAGLHLQYWYNRIKRRCFHDCIFLCK